MTQYKSSLFVIVKNVAYGVGGGFVAALVASWFLSGFFAIVVGLAAGLAIIYFAVYSDNIVITLNDGVMSVHRFGKLLHEFKVEECQFNAKVVTTSDMTGGDSDCTLHISRADGDEVHLDCSMLGRGRFMQLLDDLGFNDTAPVALATTRTAE